MKAPSNCIAVAFLPLAFGSALLAQSHQWQNPDEPFGIAIGIAMAYDAANARTVMVRGAQTWLWDGARWQLAVATNPMGARYYAGMTYDSQRDVTVLFGGSGTATAIGTWEWQGSLWARRTTTNEPAARSYAGMIFDPNRQAVLLYGGNVNGSNPGDTWEYDGTDWRQLQPATTPNPRARCGLAHDPVRGVTLLHGGLDATNSVIGETWQWNGSDWQQLFPATNPAPRSSPAMTYDSRRDRIVMHGGSAFPTQFDETWEWVGSNWRLTVPAPNGPIMNANAGMAFDQLRGECVVQDQDRGSSATWVYDGSSWTRAVEQHTPGYRKRPVLALDEDRGEILMFGRDPSNFPVSETWLNRTGSWRRGRPATAPAERADPALAFDPALRGVLMFGGSSPGILAETWLWNGNDWSQQNPATTPPARTYAAMASDPSRARVVLFGGVGAGGELSDTWEWNGVDWQQRQPATVPPARQGQAMAWNPAAQRVMMFGGGNPLFPPVLGDHWEWDGTNWQQITAPSMPAARGGAGLVWDESSQTMLLVGGHYFFVAAFPIAHSDLWEWDGARWNQRTTPGFGPFPLAVTRAAHDSATRRTLVFGAGGLSPTGAGWLLAPISPAATTHYGTACPGTFGEVELRALGLSALGNRHLRLEVTAAPPNALAFFAFGWQPLNVALGGGCTALVNPFSTIATFADARGLAMMPIALPNSPALQGLDLRAQAATLDPGGALGGIGALSDAVRMTLDL
ncbi:MAG: hypothetical protein NXI31_13515 [bacterium]|nr:hypothetical protein [bacterium]